MMRWKLVAASCLACLASLVSLVGSPTDAAAGEAASAPSSTEEHRALMISAQVMRKEGKLLRARDLLVSCSSEPCGAGPSECGEIRAFCEKRLAEVVAEIPTVSLRVEDDRGLPISAERVEVDAVTVDTSKPFVLDPGAHEAKAWYAGRSGETQLVAEVGHQKASVVVRIDLRHTVQLRPIPVPVYVLGGVAIAGGLLALGTGIYTSHSYGDLDSCRPYCDSSDRTRLQTTGYIADVSLVVALASAVAATIWFLARPTVSEVRWLGATTSDRTAR